MKARVERWTMLCSSVNWSIFRLYRKNEEAFQHKISKIAKWFIFVTNLNCFTEFVKSAETLDVDDDLKGQSS